MKILVTGGSGFIGKAFIKSYKKIFDIVAPTHEQMDLTDARSIERMFADNKFDAVLHLAGASADTVKNAPIEADNLIMFKNIQYLATVHGVKKLVAVGEGVEFDMSRPIVDYTEDKFGKNIPVDGYGMGRYLTTLLASKDKITTVLRLFQVYGQGGTCPINKIVAAGARGRKQIVLDRDRTVSAISVEDAVKVIASFLMRDYPKGDYNLTSGDKMSYLDIAKAVKRFVRRDGGDVDIVVKNPTPGLEYSASNAKLLSVMPVKLTPIQSGVKKLYDGMKR